jgi:energy-coupling factor transport system ATP-binding protein
MIRFERACYGYPRSSGAVEALTEVDLVIGTGEFVAIIGPNGSGKSTLARLANGLLVPTRGRVTVDGLDTKDKKSIFEIREKIGLVFQNPENQIVATVVENDVAFAPENLGLERSEIRARVEFALRSTGLEEKRCAMTATLSGGQKQRLAIAGVLAMKPRHLLLDEPTAMLDGSGERELLEVLTDLNSREEITVVLITHSLALASHARRVVAIEQGRVAFDGKPAALLADRTTLLRLKLDLPPAERLKDELQKRGVSVPSGVADVRGLVEHIWKVRDCSRSMA